MPVTFLCVYSPHIYPYIHLSMHTHDASQRYIYAPGCALTVYKPHLAEKLKMYIEQIYGPVDTLHTCCFHTPELPPRSCIITPCTTCAQRYIRPYPDSSSVFFLSVLADSPDFPFPDYQGARMSIQDTCSARSEPEFLDTIRRLLQRMHITVVEPQSTGMRAKCCGQTFYGKLDTGKVEALMRKRADEMPCEEVVVYCASCIMSMTIGGKRPRYILDLLFGEPTEMEKPEIVSWNKRLSAYRKDTALSSKVD